MLDRQLRHLCDGSETGHGSLCHQAGKQTRTGDEHRTHIVHRSRDPLLSDQISLHQVEEIIATVLWLTALNLI